jgi:hypothetical protein
MTTGQTGSIVAPEPGTVPAIPVDSAAAGIASPTSLATVPLGALPPLVPVAMGTPPLVIVLKVAALHLTASLAGAGAALGMAGAVGGVRTACLPASLVAAAAAVVQRRRLRGD